MANPCVDTRLNDQLSAWTSFPRWFQDTISNRACMTHLLKINLSNCKSGTTQLKQKFDGAKTHVVIGSCTSKVDMAVRGLARWKSNRSHEKTKREWIAGTWSWSGPILPRTESVIVGHCQHWHPCCRMMHNEQFREQSLTGSSWISAVFPRAWFFKGPGGVTLNEWGPGQNRP